MRHFLHLDGVARMVLLTAAATALLLLGAGPASAATLNVCPSGCPYTQIATALAAATDGDTIAIAPGTYAGGFTIEVSVKLAGAGAGRTTISGGGPVVTIGEFGASTEPTVSIDGVTITGGVTRSSWAAAFVGDGVIALGGGVEIPPNADFIGGATVTITNSVISNSSVDPA
jgi:nitrous oxidase accessory protein NosD